MIDGEILAYKDYDLGRGRMEIAAEGRGLLGTEPRSHDEGATVYFLEQVPAAILALGVKGLFELAERYLVPRGLRLKPVD